jgi:hypothetical protein
MEKKWLSTEATSVLEHLVSNLSSTVVADRRNPTLVHIRKSEKMKLSYGSTSPHVTVVSDYVSDTIAMAETHLRDFGVIKMIPIP